MPKRIQLSRQKGWRKPEGAIVVSRPSKWGNPWRVGEPHPYGGGRMTPEEVVVLYREHFASWDVSELRGKDLCCHCRLDQPCHADVLLELANK